MNRVQQLIEQVAQGARPAQVLEASATLDAKAVATQLNSDMEDLDRDVGHILTGIDNETYTTGDPAKDRAIHDLVEKIGAALEPVDRLLAALRRV